MSKKTEFYPEQSPRELGKYYTDHVAAMTVEMLHSKANIAEQLAWRDRKIDAQDAEIVALRGFAYHTYIHTTAVGGELSIGSFKHFNLIDENGNPTPLLTGESE